MPELTPHQKKALNYKDHISLTANAGSGKTFVLSKRFVEIALNESISLRNIAAITFTDKAAGDLYKKIALEIDNRIEAEQNQNEKWKLEKIRRQLVSANISTIHSFCIDIIREHPIEANVDANFTPVDEVYSAELIDHAVEEVLKENIKAETENNIVKKLIRFFASRKKLSDELTALVKNKKGILSLKERIYNKDESEIADYFFDSFKKLCAVTILAAKDDVLNAITTINNCVIAADKKNDTAIQINSLLNSINDENVLSVLSSIRGFILINKGTVRKAKYLSDKLSGGLDRVIETVEKYLPEMADAAIPENHREIEIELARVGKNILQLAEEALAKYDSKKREGGYLDFEDILIITKEILKNNDVRQKLSEKYRYLMVDEYQDTNEIQYNIFLPILEYLQKNNLFVVGDEKQSIYMFREAELEIFERTKEEIKKRRGEEGLLELPDSFRMAPEICLFTNYLFSKLFADGNRVYNEVQPKDIVCGRNDGKKGRVELLISREEENNDEIIFPSLSDLIALRIDELVHDKTTGIDVSYNDIAVLCRKRSAFPELEKTFSKHGIPYTILGGKGFFQRQLVKDFYNYFAFLLNPENDIALAGILRSPFFAVDDSVLYLVSLEDGNDYWGKTKLYAEKNTKLKLAVEKIEKNLRLKTVLDIASLFRKILDETNYIAVAASQQNREVEFENLNKLINLSIEFFNTGFKTLYDYVVYLKESIKDFEDEGQAEPAENENVVKIMTIHQSKGLEFDAVFLYSLGDKAQKSMVKSKSILVDKNFGLLTKVPLNGNYFSDYESAPIVKLANHIIERKEAAEMKRLFYVAVTRAKTYLFITSGYNGGSFPEDSMMGLMTDALKINFDEGKHLIKSELTYLRNNGNGYFNDTEIMELEIPVIDDVVYRKPFLSDDGHNEIALKNMVGKIEDHPENEIFSATKISTYIQCPLKYKLNYEFNFNPLFGEYFSWIKGKPSKAFSSGRNREIEPSKIPELRDEEEKNVYPEIKGRIIHSALQNNIEKELLPSFIKERLLNDLFIELQNENEINNLVNKISNEIIKFYDSAVYEEIAAANKSFNEFEIFVNDNNYILHGIIDKLIDNNGDVIILDYKTDDIEENKLEERYKSYLSQLKFYSYIVSRYLNNFNKLTVRVIFIKYPDLIFSEEVDKEQLALLGKEYSQIIQNIRNGFFNKKIENCKNCIYSVLDEKCIVN